MTEAKLSKLQLSLAISIVFLSCCICVYVLELITSELPGAGNIVTLAQFAFIALEGLIFESRFLMKRRNVPLKSYLYLVIMFFLVSVANNFALGCQISMPLHMIFKSGSLIANMLLGILLLKRRYVWTKYFAVVLITVGITTCTIASTTQNTQPNQASTYSPFMGILLLTFALIAAARMGIYQETLFTKHGKHPREALFYCHALPLPGFLILYNDIYSHAVAFSASTPITVPLLVVDLVMPKHWFYLIIVAIAQYVCARSVFTLTTECSSLTVTLVITLRKFLSLVASIIYFKNPFTWYHWLGATLVFIGTFVFVDFPFNYLRKTSTTEEKDKVKFN